MKTYTNELELLRDEVEKCHKIIENQIQMLKDAISARHAKHPWVRLTDGVMCDIAIEHGLMSIEWIDFARAIEQASEEKNT